MTRIAKLPPVEEIRVSLARFLRKYELYTDAAAVPQSISVPDDWLQLLKLQHETRLDLSPTWNSFSSELPIVLKFLENSLLGYALLLEENEPPALLYIYSAAGKLRFFIGHLPLSLTRLADSFAMEWPKFPQTVRRFYESLHDGWVKLSSGAIGPLPTSRVKLLSDDEWDLDDAELSRFPFRMYEVYELFSNGAGDYLCIDISKSEGSQQALVFWREEPTAPDVNQDFWAVLNAWFSIFVEDADPA